MLALDEDGIQPSLSGLDAACGRSPALKVPGYFHQGPSGTDLSKARAVIPNQGPRHLLREAPLVWLREA